PSACMAASLITRAVLPSAREKSNPTQPLPRCFGSRTMRPWRTGAGNPIEIASNFQPVTHFLIFATISRGLSAGPESNLRSSLIDMSNFTCVPPISATRTLFFIIERLSSATKLFASANGTRETLEHAFAFRFYRRARRPAFDDLEGEKSKKRQARKLQIHPQILGDLLDRSSAVELGRELRFGHGKAKILHPLKTVTCVSWNGGLIVVRALAKLLKLNKAQSRERPIVHVPVSRNPARVAGKFALVKNKTDAWRSPKIGEEFLAVMFD